MPKSITRTLQLAAVRNDAAALTAVAAGTGRRRVEAKADDDGHDKPDAGDEQGAKPNTGDEPPPPNESKPETGEPPSADAPKADDEEDDKANGLDAAEAAQRFVEAFKQYMRGSDKE